MSALIRFFIRYATVFEFLFLEIIALVLFFNFNSFQQSALYRFNMSIVSATYSVTSRCADYLYLADENAVLRAENEALINQLHAQQADSTFAEHDVLTAKSARVVFGTIDQLQNMLIMDLGAADGIKPDMGVVSTDGVVGVVDAVTEHFSVVMPLINTNLLVSGKLLKNNYLGSISWDGVDASSAKLTEIPHHVDVQVGDTIVTSGYSAIFSEGIPLAVVSHVNADKNKTFCDIRVRLLTNFRTLRHVYVLDCANRDELQQLQNTIE